MTPGMPRVTAIIVTFQSSDTIAAALDALQPAHATGLAEVVVVDNASDDGTPELVADRYPWVTLVHSGGNLGYGRACNIGFEYATTPYLLVMNPDAVVDVVALDRLLEFMDEREEVGMCGPAVVEDSGNLQPAGAMPGPWKIMLKPLLSGWAGRGVRKVVPGEPPMRTSWICGSIMLIRRELIDEVGGFDPRFFLYFEESDLCRRAQRAGWQVWTVGEAACRHVNAASAKRTGAVMMWGTIPEHYFPSRFYYLVKHHGWPAALAAEIGELCAMSLRALLERIRGRTYPALGARLRAPFMKLPRRPEVVGER